MTLAELNEVRELWRQVNDKKKEILALRQSMALKVPVRDGLPKGTPQESRIERLVVRIADAEAEVAELTRRIDEEVAPRLEQKIRTEIDDETARTLFVLRYVDCLFFQQIAFVMQLSERYIYRIHDVTIKKLKSSGEVHLQFSRHM